jgi:hypothetical protein
MTVDYVVVTDAPDTYSYTVVAIETEYSARRFYGSGAFFLSGKNSNLIWLLFAGDGWW